MGNRLPEEEEVVDVVEESNLVPLPPGSRVQGCVLNLVGSEFAAGLATYMEADGAPSGERPLGPLGQAFYANYFDEYDFLVFVSPEQLNSEFAGLHTKVRSRTIPGTGVRALNLSSEYGSAGRLRSAIGIDQVEPGAFPPLAHEVLHHWAVDLDDSLGFGDDFAGAQAPHWGTVSVDGVLGGFALDSLRCKTPTGALPPDCTAEASGAYHYVVAPFHPRSSRKDKPFAPLELYLMGLLPLAEVPESYTILTDALPEPVSTGIDHVVIEAGPIATVTMAEVVALHGERQPVPEAERALSMAVVVVTDEPATDALLAEVDTWTEVFGGRTDSAEWPSFAALTGGRATMNTCLGARRELDSPEDVPVVDESDCSPLAQDCGDGLSCYGATGAVCLPTGLGAYGDVCDYDNDCAAGLGCGITFGGSWLCSPYCDAEDLAAADACETLCPGAWMGSEDEGGNVSAVGHCLGGNGVGACDPVLQDCVGDLACYGGVGGAAPSCSDVGTIADQQPCTFRNDCTEGFTCVSFGDEPSTCARYCALDTSASGCATVCPAGYWSAETFGLCYPSL